MKRSLSITVANHTGLVHYPTAARITGDPVRAWIELPAFLLGAWANGGKWVRLTMWGGYVGRRQRSEMPQELCTEFKALMARYRLPFVGNVEVGVDRNGWQYCRVILARRRNLGLELEIPDSVAYKLREMLACF